MGGGCYLANRITTKLHLHFPLPHYNDTVLYSKMNFYISQPPQLPQQLGGCYLANRITTKLYLHFPLPHYNDITKPTSSIPPTLGGGGVGLSHKLDYHKTLTSTFPLTIMWCYISKRSFTNVSLLYSPNSWGVVISQTGLPQNSTSPPYNDVVLHSKATSTKVNLLNSPNKNPKISSLGDNCSPPNFWSETQKTKPTKQNKQTNKNTRPFGDIMIMLPPLPPPPPLTSSPSPNGDTILKLWCYLSNQTWKIQTLSVPIKNIMFSRKNRSLPQKLQ